MCGAGRAWRVSLIPLLFGVGVRLPGAASFPGTALPSFRSSFSRGPPPLGRGRCGTVMVDQFMDCERGALVGYHRVERRLLASIDLSELSVKQLTLVLLHDENEVLLGMKKRGFGEGKWNGFGGKVEPGETILDAAVRELEEECGASVAPQELVQRALLTFIFEKNPKIMQVHVFTGKLSSLRGDPTETEEMRPKKWKLDEIPFDTMWDDDQYWMHRALNAENFQGSFLFTGEKVVDHTISSLPDPFPAWSMSPEELFAFHNLKSWVDRDREEFRARVMRDDVDVAITSARLHLVPYRKRHVATYHSWMQDEELLRLTGSEPLSLEEEMEMQEKWVSDTDKQTFIVLRRRADGADKWSEGAEEEDMIGDANLFFYEKDAGHAEINLMIAKAETRGQGYGAEAVRLLMHYGYARLGARLFVAKIDEDNEPSLALFRRLGFSQTSHSSAFRQYTLEWTPSEAEAAALRQIAVA